mgnify:CR=1 FL=1
MRGHVLETVIGYILIVGVVASLMMEVIGLAMYVADKGFIDINLSNSEAYVKSQDFFVYMANTAHSLLEDFNYVNVMALGLAILMLTPYLRVVASLLYFAITRNYKYTMITLMVLTMLTLSLILH